MRGNVFAEILEVDFSIERNAFCMVFLTHTPANGLYILLYRVKYKAGKSLFCVRLEAEIQLELGLDLNRESTALAVLHICSERAEIYT